MTNKNRKKLDRRIRKNKRRFAQTHTNRYAVMVEATNPFIYPRTYMRTILDLAKVR